MGLVVVRFRQDDENDVDRLQDRLHELPRAGYPHRFHLCAGLSLIEEAMSGERSAAEAHAAARLVARYGKVDVDGIFVHYRECGPKDAPAILLLHGFPSSGHMFRNLIPMLCDDFRLVAPDLPGFGESDHPPHEQFPYTFETLAKVIASFTDIVGLKKYAMYLFDYGAPGGLRLALEYPDRVTAIISQNGNAYVDGMGEHWAPVRAFWDDPTPERRLAMYGAFSPGAIYRQYADGV